MAKNCVKCGLRAEVAKAVGVKIVNGKCDGCRTLFAVSIENRTSDPRAVACGWANLDNVRNISKTGGEWTPEIAEAMRIR